MTKECPEPDDVAKPSRRRSKTGKHKEVGVDDPMGRDLRQAKIADDSRQGNANHGFVEDDDTKDGAHRPQDPPFSRIVVDLQHTRPNVLRRATAVLRREPASTIIVSTCRRSPVRTTRALRYPEGM